LILRLTPVVLKPHERGSPCTFRRSGTLDECSRQAQQFAIPLQKLPMRFNTLRPMLETADLQQTITFYTELLGFTCAALYPNSETPYWTCLCRDDVEIMFTVRSDHSVFEKPVMTGSLYFNTDNVDEIWEHLKDKAVVEYPLENFDYGMREFAIRDCNGYLLQFGKELMAE
jgi:uncharacterized glyoxalase superfamily protein PhnB